MRDRNKAPSESSLKWCSATVCLIVEDILTNSMRWMKIEKRLIDKASHKLKSIDLRPIICLEWAAIQRSASTAPTVIPIAELAHSRSLQGLCNWVTPTCERLHPTTSRINRSHPLFTIRSSQIYSNYVKLEPQWRDNSMQEQAVKFSLKHPELWWISHPLCTISMAQIWSDQSVLCSSIKLRLMSISKEKVFLSPIVVGGCPEKSD